MEPQDLTYALGRCYITDLPVSTLRPGLRATLLGWIRSRSLARLATCTDLSRPALSTRDEWRALMQIEAFFKKNKSFSDEQRCREAARLSFEKGELLCRLANRRLDHYYTQRGRLDPDLSEWMDRVERDVSTILGPFRTFLDVLPKMVRVTAGATSTKSRRKSLPHLRMKMPYATPQAIPYLSALCTYFGYEPYKVRETLANRLEFVPKNWKTYRTIACEPEGNVFLQLAVDKYIKRRLRRIGIDLSNQSRNQVMAKEGSVSGDLATIDLSMASDTLAFNTVAWLFPKSWFDFLNAVRSPTSRGVAEVKYAKFSSMGNGCTFTLETLVFASCCRAVGSKRSVVYGDDIVIETHLVPKLTKLLRFLGFTINTEKSHTDGPFRESCGANWYSGVDITPVYVRDIDSRKAMMCHLVNTLASIAKPDGELEKLLLSIIVEQKLPLVPWSRNTTSGVWVNTPVARKRKLIRSQHRVKGFGTCYHVPKYQGYVPVSPGGTSRGARAAFLWYLDTLERGRSPVLPESCSNRPSSWYAYRYANPKEEPGVYVCKSRYTTSSHRFRRKWVHWHEDVPVVGELLYLDRWSEVIDALLPS